MTEFETAAACLGMVAMAGIVSVVVVSRAAYRNGVTDGYGYSREPTCPGYADAGRYLRTYMAHRWHELNDPCAVGKIQAEIVSLIVVAWPNLNPESRLLFADWLLLQSGRLASDRSLHAVNDNNHCRLPPAGWRCTRPVGHDGPCAAWPVDFGLGDAKPCEAPAAAENPLLESCCKCGELYLRADLLRGEIYCPTCRVQDEKIPPILSL